MKNQSPAFLLPPLLAALPLPTAAPMPPDQLRAHNPWNLPMTGVWRFQLTYGQIKAGQFVPSEPVRNDVTASSHQEEKPPEAAFDGSNDTRWCASNGDFPQWLQADLGTTRHVSGVTLAWENPGDSYEYRIEGRSQQSGKWQTLLDKTAVPGIGDGPVTLKPADVRYVRIFVTANSSGEHWASLREFQIHTTENGREVAWQPPVPKSIPADASVAVRDAFAAPGFNDAAWHDMPVPSNWEMAGYSLPTYDSVDKTVGLYRRFVTVPASWAGRREWRRPATPCSGLLNAAFTGSRFRTAAGRVSRCCQRMFHWPVAPTRPPSGTTLFASHEVAGPHGLSGSWVADHAIHAVKGKPLSGAFTLRAVSTPGLIAHG